MPLLPLLLTYFTDILLLLCGRITNTKTATRWYWEMMYDTRDDVMFPSLAAQLWSSYLSLWHSHSIDGLDNIPAEGPGRSHFSWQCNDSIWCSRPDSLVPRPCPSGLHGAGGQDLPQLGQEGLVSGGQGAPARPGAGDVQEPPQVDTALTVLASSARKNKNPVISKICNWHIVAKERERP